MVYPGNVQLMPSQDDFVGCKNGAGIKCKGICTSCYAEPAGGPCRASSNRVSNVGGFAITEANEINGVN